MSKRFEARPLASGLTFGVEIVGLRSDDIDDPETQEALRHHWVKDGVLVFRGLEGAETHLALSRVFGPLIGHPIQTQDPARREIMTIRFDPDDAYITEVDGVPLGAWLPWHSDLVHFDKINHGGILRPLRLPSRGGETGFIDKIASYDALPSRLKERIEDLAVVYQFRRDPTEQRFGRNADVRVLRENKIALAWKKQTFPFTLHPMVYTQQETGRKMLNVSPWFAIKVDGLAPEESDLLLEEIMHYATDASRAYFHRWEMGQMVLWDNWRVLHCATGCPAEEERWMERTTIQGDYGLGRFYDRQGAEEQNQIEI